MDHPHEFSTQARARVEAERLRANRELEQSQTEQPPTSWKKSQWEWDGSAFYLYILRVFLAFAREACELGKLGTWAVDRIRSEADEFLRRFTIEAYYEKGHDRHGRKFLKMVGDWDGSLRPEVEQKFHKSEEWREFEEELLAVAERQAAQNSQPNSPVDSLIGRLPKAPASSGMTTKEGDEADTRGKAAGTETSELGGIFDFGPPDEESNEDAPSVHGGGTKRLQATVTSLIAARRMEAYIESKAIGQTEFAITVGTTDRTLRTFRRTGRVRRDIFDAIARAMGTTREALLKPE